MKNEKDATELAKWMISIVKKLKKDVRAEITNMDQPLGRMIGNKNEILEAMESLKGNGEPRFMELIYSSSSEILMQAKIVKNKKEAIKLIDDAIKSQKAYKKFIEMINNQGGNSKIICQPQWWNPKYKLIIKANKEGYLRLTNSVVLGTVAMKLGAGRQTKEDIIDNEAGIELVKVSNEYVKKNDPIMILYSSKEIDLSLSKEVWKSIEISKNLKNDPIILNNLK